MQKISIKNHSNPLDLIIHFREKHPAINDKTTKIITENNIVFQGIGIEFTLSKNPSEVHRVQTLSEN